MPTLSRYFIRSALVSLATGFTLGGLLLAAKGGAVDMRVWGWLPVHIILLLNGWLVQLSMGVAYWIMPRIQVAERGRRQWAWASFVVLQSGLSLAVLSGLRVWLPDSGQLFAPAVVLQFIAVILFAFHIYPRIRPAFVRAVTEKNQHE